MTTQHLLSTRIRTLLAEEDRKVCAFCAGPLLTRSAKTYCSTTCAYAHRKALTAAHPKPTHKTCTKCGVTSELASFYKKGAVCRKCTIAKSAAWRMKNKALLNERQRERYASDAEYRAKLLESAKTPSARKAHTEANRRWREANREKFRAHWRLDKAVKAGKLIPWPVCAVPECCGKPEAHHADYSRPLDVVWLCPAHHKGAHLAAETVTSPNANATDLMEVVKRRSTAKEAA